MTLKLLINFERWLACVLLALAVPATLPAQNFTPVLVDDTETKADDPSDQPPAKDPGPLEDKVPGDPDERGFFEMHHWGVWLADPAQDRINAREHFLTNMPRSIETSRPRKMKNDKKPPSPLNVVTFYGEPTKTVDLDLRVKAGAPLAHWPPAQIKSSRLHWPEYELAKVAPEDASWLGVPSEHWFNTLRKTDGLVVRKGARAEKFVTYDFDAAFPLPLKLEGGPDTYKVRSSAAYPLHDLVIVLPTESGRRIAWLDLLPAAPEPKPAQQNQPNQPNNQPNQPNQPGQPGQPVPPGAVPAAAVAGAGPVAVPPQAVVNGVVQQAGGPNQPGQPNQPNQPNQQGARQPGPPVEMKMSEPLPADSEQLTAQTTKALTDRLVATGLNRGQIDQLVTMYGPTIFGASSLIVAYRIPSGTVDDLNPLVAEPEPAKTVRVVLVVAQNLDPVIEASLQVLVDQLGNPRYKVREEAEERLRELGSLAFGVLKKSLTATDPEVAFRAERLLSDQGQQIPNQQE
jgi:hypothetical protein